MNKRRFVTLDVFSRQRLAGNPLAVVLDAEGLRDGDMQAIAREFNLSETVFVLPDPERRHRALVRIFTPTAELSFAGHPTVGTAFLLACLDQGGKPGQLAFGLSEKVGSINCAIDVETAYTGYAQFRLPGLSQTWGEGREVAECAWALGLEPRDICFERHEPSRYSAGIGFDLVPLASLDALARAKVNADGFARVFQHDDRAMVYLYCRDGAPSENRFRARMFSAGLGFNEDPATGAAVAALSGALMQFEPIGNGERVFSIGQGYEMGRPSEIVLKVALEQGAMTFAEIGGHAVIVARGELAL